ncbi:hypothetical protein COT62_02310 [Candidatus Roizmanbacteria bacterium CG09_land_8_20_14_0_10_41_9]|uniref:Sodium/calcium exchanger membrane region domain-containing protein n=1 Tax=Candidatus Roizmanbacteria bacterium CG09_land_8_20_14_0_10_41_9 TaxID=1974850 RepID=A0A2H0WUU5_9BACT|nr:MAG: hypothetical protein COT62_02310 [Candidatus Roizmanbacteria bacterium CG09_land_8_20_14_0_10_41_9]
MIINIFLYLLSFVFIWFGSGLIVSSIDTFARKLRISSFALSFFVLGLFTSIPEISLGINSIVEKEPEILVGDIIGEVIVIYLLLIPTLAIIGNGIKLNRQLNNQNLLLAMLVCLTPAFLISDRILSLSEGLLLILLYGLLFYFIEKNQGILEAVERKFAHPDGREFLYIGKIILGTGIVFLSSRYLVDRTVFFSQILNISPFLISLIALSLGTNLPELSVGIRSLYSGKKDIAFGDYVGSAAANTLILGVLTIFNGSSIVIPNHFFQRFFFMFIGLSLFYFFSRSKNDISRIEGIGLLYIYLLFLLVEIVVS